MASTGGAEEEEGDGMRLVRERWIYVQEGERKSVVVLVVGLGVGMGRFFESKDAIGFSGGPEGSDIVESAT
jgi:hypothetical protein